MLKCKLQIQMLKFVALSFHCYLAADGKSVGTYSVILKKPATTPYTLLKCWILSKIGRNESFFWAQHCWEEWEDEGMNPELMKKIVIRSLWNSHLKRFFYSVWSSFDLYFHYWTAHHFNSLDKTTLVCCLCFHKHTE